MSNKNKRSVWVKIRKWNKMKKFNTKNSEKKKNVWIESNQIKNIFLQQAVDH